MHRLLRSKIREALTIDPCCTYGLGVADGLVDP